MSTENSASKADPARTGRDVKTRPVVVVAATLLAGVTVLAGCAPERSDVLSVLDGEGYVYCAQATSDGSATFALSRVENTGDEAVVAVEDVDLVEPIPGVTSLGGYFSTGPTGPTSGSPFDADALDDPIPPGESAFLAIGVALTGAPGGESPGASVTYRTESGQIGEVTTKIGIRIVEGDQSC